MNKEIKEKWADALRSGEYKQGKNFLRRHGRHCCLGVLCELYLGDNSDSRWESVGAYDYFVPSCGRRFTQFIPEVVKKWSGLLDPLSDDFTYEGMKMSLVGLNDRGATFEEIADLIEAEL